MKIVEKYMFRCIQLAKNGLGTTYPNPLVGSLIVHNNIIIGEGWHFKSGSAHAEVNAIESVVDKSLLAESTIYVSLEPCSHFGKTPPCADLIIDSGIKKVVVGSVDPNPKVAGNGIERLGAAGCEVETGILEEECDDLNKRFFSYHKNHRPYIILKWAQTSDGFIAPSEGNRTKKQPIWITNETSRQIVHKMRSEEQAILVGTNTVLNDNPSLTTRDWRGNSPIRIVLDRDLKISREASVFDEKAKTIILTQKEATNSGNLFYEQINFSEVIAQQICDILYRYKIQSVIIEGGTRTIQTFIDENLWDEAFVFKGKSKFEQGVKAPDFSSTPSEELKIESDSLLIHKNLSR